MIKRRYQGTRPEQEEVCAQAERKALLLACAGDGGGGGGMCGEALRKPCGKVLLLACTGGDGGDGSRGMCGEALRKPSARLCCLHALVVAMAAEVCGEGLPELPSGKVSERSF